MNKLNNKFNLLGIVGTGGLLVLGTLLLTPATPFTTYATEYCKGPDGYVECDVTSQINTYARLAPVVSLGMQGDVVMDVTPKSTGVLIEKPVSVKVSTNSSEGYSLYLKALGETNALTSTNPDNNSKISAVEGEVTSSGLKEQGNVWGYSLHPQDSTAEILYKAVPLNQDTPVRVTDSVVSGGTDNLELTFGMYVDTSLPSGVYSNAVLVSAVANPATISNLSELTFMQDMSPEICANTAYDEDGATDPSVADPLKPVTKQLIDTRDGKKYWVAKLKDGKCWMTQNLALDLEEGKQLTPSDTNVAASWTIPVETQHGSSEGIDTNYGSFDPGEYVLTNFKGTGSCSASATNGTTTTSTYYSLADEGCADYVQEVSGWQDTFDATETASVDIENQTYDAHYSVGNYYANKAARIGDSGDSDICAANWRLPQVNSTNYGAYETSEYYQLFAAYGDSGWTFDNDLIRHSLNLGNGVSAVGRPLYVTASGLVFGSSAIGYIGYGYYGYRNKANGVGAAMNLHISLFPFRSWETDLRNIRCVAK